MVLLAHLGMDINHDDDDTLCITSLKYIEKMIRNYKKIFGELPKQNITMQLEKGDHDDSKLLDTKGIAFYQSMIGAIQCQN